MRNGFKRVGILVLATILLMLTLSGCACKHQWSEATCEEPATCTKCGETEGVSLGHRWKDATCDTACTCSRCGKTKGGPLGHNWIDATCDTPATCSLCGETKGEVLEHNWQEATETTPKMCTNCGMMEPLPTPANGQVFIGKGSACFSELSITNDSTACYIKLKDGSGNDVYSFFVRAGEKADVKVPAGNYYVYFASGYDWYGPEYLFGEYTSYSKDPEALDFYNYAWSYTLQPVENGNFSDTPIDEEDF